jgi:arylsulfatase A-like enzyme
VKPHPPLDPPAPYDRYYDKVDIPPAVAEESEFPDKPTAVTNKMDRSLIEEGNRGPAVRRFYGLITLIDHAVGEIMQGLERSGKADNTIVLFTSDHGDYMGDHFMTGKEFFHDPAARVPLIAAGPGIHRGGSAATLAGHVDILPTVLDFAGVALPSRLDGISLRSAMHEPSKQLREELFGELHRGIKTLDGVRWIGQKMIRTLRHKYIFYSRGFVRDAFEEELYLMESDPNELRNRAAEYPALCRELRDRILQWQVHIQANQLYPVDDRYPLSRLDPKTGKVSYDP